MRLENPVLFGGPPDTAPAGRSRAEVRLREYRLLDEVRGIVRDGLLAAHPWIRDPELQAADGPAIRQVTRAPIPFSRVQQLLRDLLGQQDLSHIRGLSVELGAVVVEVYALDEHGRKFAVRDADGQHVAAIDRIHIPVSR